MNSQRKGKEPMGASRKRGYMAWNSQMDAILTSTLFDQINEGNKGNGDFEAQAYQAVVDKLRDELDMPVTLDHVKNRIKVWKKHHATITEIREYTKFKRDEDKKMLVIPIDELELWYAYCKDHPHASAYKNKCIDNWDDICALVGLDKATAEGAEQHEESAKAMDVETEGTSETQSETSNGGSNKKLKRDHLVDVVSCFAESFKEFVSKSQGAPKPSSREIYDLVSSILGLSRQQVLKAVKRFMSGPAEEFEML